MVGRCATHLKTKKAMIKNTFICVCVCVFVCARACVRACVHMHEHECKGSNGGVFFLYFVVVVSVALLMLSTAS